MVKKRNRKSIFYTLGHLCPKCDEPMSRFKHGVDWKPRDKQPYYFAYWDICKSCKHIQLYEKAKVYVKEQSEDNWENEFDMGRPERSWNHS